MLRTHAKNAASVAERTGSWKGSEASSCMRRASACVARVCQSPWSMAGPRLRLAAGGARGCGCMPAGLPAAAAAAAAPLAGPPSGILRFSCCCGLGAGAGAGAAAGTGATAATCTGAGARAGAGAGTGAGAGAAGRGCCAAFCSCGTGAPANAAVSAARCSAGRDARRRAASSRSSAALAGCQVAGSVGRPSSRQAVSKARRQSLHCTMMSEPSAL